jgi:hypothetical protein
VRRRQRWRGRRKCTDGSEFAFFERRADPTKVVFFLDGGGGCFDAKTCAFTALGAGGEEKYDWKITDDPVDEDGIINFARADNPFRGDDYFFFLTYGSDIEWVKNVLAAGWCSIETRGRVVELVELELITILSSGRRRHTSAWSSGGSQVSPST